MMPDPDTDLDSEPDPGPGQSPSVQIYSYIVFSRSEWANGLCCFVQNSGGVVDRTLYTQQRTLTRLTGVRLADDPVQACTCYSNEDADD